MDSNQGETGAPNREALNPSFSKLVLTQSSASLMIWTTTLHRRFGTALQAKKELKLVLPSDSHQQLPVCIP
jgi:hypothetical protein